MSRGKYYSLEEARNANDVQGYAKENKSKGDKDKFNDILERMAKNLPVADQTSKKG